MAVYGRRGGGAHFGDCLLCLLVLYAFVGNDRLSNPKPFKGEMKVGVSSAPFLLIF